MRVLADAIARSRSTDPTLLRDALAATKGFAGVTGVISMDSERNAVKPAVVLKLQDAKYIYQETIQPETAVTPSPSPSPSPSVSKKKKR
jgi:branched-chain amino acid transport system substrate-binding protein